MYRPSLLLCLIIASLVAPSSLPVNVIARSNTPQFLPNTIFIPLITRTITHPPLSPNWLDRVNGYRARAGVPPVTESSALNSNCWEHARYMAENNHLTHNQDPTKPFASPAGQICAQKGNAWIAWGNSWQPADAVDSWMKSIGHRIWLLYPTTPTFGFGFYTTATAKCKLNNYNLLCNGAALDVLSHFNPGADTDYPGWPVRYPGIDQTDVPATTYPITLQWRYFGSTPSLTSTTLRVVGGNAIPHTSTTSLPVGHKGIAITPTVNLPANSLIEVSVSGTYDDQPFTYTWQFRTGN
ncbi:CAP domain-containing protein [Chloroflexus sp.]|uniref:CAP domain-containing protein n=1 Tax=Chloroflexus sp. TaxID=1904827 RepID=UPI002ACD4F5B|nr:CAP domain-containing protein [Chloroflexus sp.]